MNKVVLVGRFTREPDIRQSQGPDPTMVARFTLAVDRRYAKQNDPNAQTADFISCIAFGKTAEFIEKYFHKGTKAVLEGRIQTGSYTNKDGQKVYTTDVVTENIEFAESKRAAEENGQQTSAPSASGSRTSVPAAGGGNNQSRKGNTPPEEFMNIPDGVEDEGLPWN